jgi:predicted SAM-dependent methyltransferase
MPDIADLLNGLSKVSQPEIVSIVNDGKSRLSAGVRSAVQELSRELRIQLDHETSLENARKFVGERHLKLHLGCGSEHKAGWINIDLRPDADLQLDVREPLPFGDGTVAIVYSEHFFEHLEYPGEATNLLRESLRALEPGGVFSVGVPDAEEILRQYAKGEMPALMQEWSKDENMQWLSPWIWETPMHFVNFVFRQDCEHKYAYDFETLARVLGQAGFVNVRRREFRPDLDSEHRRDGTLYVDAAKPISPAADSVGAQ